MGSGNRSSDLIRQDAPQRRVAIIGSGPGGLVAAKFLKQHGWEPVLFEQSDSIGGQWNARSAHSGVWPSMVTNTSRWLTCFSDLAPEPNAAIFPSNEAILAYLGRYAQRFDLLSRIRYETRVEWIERDPGGCGWVIRSNGTEKRSGTFPYVVIASGRFTKPRVPSLPGLASFCGPGGVLQSLQYKRSEGFRGQRVLVVGCAISALEIASDLAMLGAARVVSSFRRNATSCKSWWPGYPRTRSRSPGSPPWRPASPSKAARTCNRCIRWRCGSGWAYSIGDRPRRRQTVEAFGSIDNH
jgi:dimethylaniline monooxygenase (N-oxide forming)